MDKRYFVNCMGPSGTFYVGILSSGDFLEWKSAGKAICLENPQVLQVQPISQTKLSLVMAPSRPISTKQEKLYMIPSEIEIIGEIIVESGEERVLEEKDLFSQYKQSLTNYRARLAGIVAPGMAGAKLINKDNVLPFNKK